MDKITTEVCCCWAHYIRPTSWLSSLSVVNFNTFSKGPGQRALAYFKAYTMNHGRVQGGHFNRQRCKIYSPEESCALSGV